MNNKLTILLLTILIVTTLTTALNEYGKDTTIVDVDKGEWYQDYKLSPWETLIDTSNHKRYRAILYSNDYSPRFFKQVIQLVGVRADKKNLYQEIVTDEIVRGYENQCTNEKTLANGTTPRTCEVVNTYNTTHEETTLVLIESYENIIMIKGEPITLIFDLQGFNPIIYSGMAGLYAPDIDAYYHPPINSSFISVDFTTDNISTSLWSMTDNTSTNIFNASVSVMAQYNLDESSGVVIDRSGHTNATNNGATPSSTGIINTGYDFVRANADFIRLDAAIGELKTFITWLNPDTAIDASLAKQYILAEVGSNNNPLAVGSFTGDCASEIFSIATTGGVTACYSGVTIANGGYSMLTMVWDNATGEYDIYVNTTQATLDEGDQLIMTGFHYELGMRTNFGGGDPYDGLMDEVLFMNRSVTFAEISELYNTGSAKRAIIDQGNYVSDTFNTGDNYTAFTPTYTCDGFCQLNITIENELFVNVSSGKQQNLSTPPTNNATLDNFTISLDGTTRTSLLGSLNISFGFDTGIDQILISTPVFQPLDADKNGLGTSFTSALMESIEFMRFNFTVNSTRNISVMTFNYTANGTNACAIGNIQSSVCLFNQSNILFQEGFKTLYFDATGPIGSLGDIINVTFTGSTTNRAYSVLTDENYNPNGYKAYGALFNWSNIVFQNGMDQRITGNNALKITLGNIVPINADQYKLDFRLTVTNSPIAPIEAYGCNSTFITGDASTIDECVLIATKLESELTDNGTRFRAIFTKTVLNGLGDLKHIVLRTNENNPTRYYSLRTYGYTNATWAQRWNYSTNDGAIWQQTGDNTESELNINWFNSLPVPTSYHNFINVNDTNGLKNSEGWNGYTWDINTSQNFPPLLTINTPEDDATSTEGDIINISWTVSELNGDNYTTTVNVSNATVTTTLGVNISVSLRYIEWNTTGFAGTFNITVEACENETSDLFCTQQIIFHTIQTIPVPPSSPLENATCALFNGCFDGVNECLVAVNWTGEPSVLNEDCVTFRTRNTTFIFIFYFIALSLIAVASFTRFYILGAVGSLIGFFISLGLIGTWSLYGGIGIFFFLGIGMVYAMLGINR